MRILTNDQGLHLNAHVAELVDALSSGGSAFGREGSTPFVRTV